MNHILVFIIILALAFGTAALFQSFQFYKTYPFPVLRFYIIYLAISNLISLLNLISIYIPSNVSPLSAPNSYFIIVVLLGSIGFALAAFGTYYLILFIWKLLDIELHLRVKIIYGAVFSLWSLTFSFGVFQYFISGNMLLLLYVHKTGTYILTILCFLLSLFLVIKAGKIKHSNRLVAVKSFGYFYLTLSSLGVITFLIRFNFELIVFALEDLLAKLFVLLFMKWFLVRFYGAFHILPHQQAILESVCGKYHISVREKEIIEMILRGLSNKEIEQKLYISSHTVKNHIYNIFQKLEITSRGQLINLVLEFSANN